LLNWLRVVCNFPARIYPGEQIHFRSHIFVPNQLLRWEFLTLTG